MVFCVGAARRPGNTALLRNARRGTRVQAWLPIWRAARWWHVTTITDVDHLLQMANYPGMIPAESRILRQYIRRYRSVFHEWRFGVRIGEGVQVGDEFSPEVQRAFEAVTKARPDTVAFIPPNDATIIEVKEAFANEAVWQLLAYRDLYVRAFPEHRVRLVGVAQFAGPTARSLAATNGIQLHLYTLPPGQIDINEQAAEDI